MEDEKRLLCMKEIEIVQATIARYDNNGSTIKSWCITTWSAVSAYALTERASAVALVGLAVILGFAILELTYRRFQRRFIDRAAEIELLLESGQWENYKYSINAIAARKAVSEVSNVLRLPHFIIFYIMLVVFSLAVTFYCVKYPLHDYSLYLRLSL